MPSFQPATRQNYENLQNLLNGASAYGAYGESDFDRHIRQEGGYFVLSDGTVVSFNSANKTVYIAVDSAGKMVKGTRSGAEYTALLSQARRSGRKISPEEGKRRQEDAGRKYKTAAVRVNDKLLYKTWKAPKVDATVEVTPSWLKVTYNRDHTARGVTYKAGKQVVIKNDDPGYRQWADELNAAYMAGQLTLARGATSADDAEKRRTAKAKLDPKLLGKTWNDGTYTYKVGNDRTVKVKDKTWTPGKGTYDTVAKQLNVMLSEKKLKAGALEDSAALDASGLKEMKADLQMSETGEKGTGEEEGEAAASVASSTSEEPKAEIRDGKGKDGGLTDSKYFWPAVGVGGLALAGGVYFFFFRNK